MNSKLSIEEAQANIALLKGQVESWLAVLFNVYGSVDREFRGMVGDVIISWMGIADKKVRNSRSDHVCLINEEHVIGDT